MLVNGVDISTFKAKLLTKDIQPAQVTIYDDWLRNAINPLYMGKQETFKVLKLQFLVSDSSDENCLTDISNLVGQFEKCVVKFDDLSFYYDCTLTSSDSARLIQVGYFSLNIELKSRYAYKTAVSSTISGQSGTINVQGNLPSPAIVTLTPTQDIDNVSLAGLTKKAITVNTLHSGAPVTINSEKCTITEPDLDTIMTSATGSGKWMFRKYNAPNIFSPDVMNANYIPTIDTIPDNSAYMRLLCHKLNH